MTGRTMRFFLPIVVLLIGVATAQAAVDVGAELDRDRAAVGDQLVLTVRVTGEARDVRPPAAPDMAAFQVFGGGQSQRFSFVNGQVSAEHSFTFYLQPQAEGRFEVPPIRVQVDGQQFVTTAIPIEVSASTGGGASAAEPQDAAPSGEVGEDAFVTMTVDRDSVVVGEQIVLTFSLYRSSRLSAFASPEYTRPRTEGFWREDLPPELHSTRVLRSRRYEVHEIRYALFPTRAGQLEIGEAMVRMPEDLFGNFFRSRGRGSSKGPRVLRAEAIPITVSPLPAGAPADFNGTVASDLRLSATVDRRELTAGEALTLSIRLEGDGYLPGISLPELDGLDDFRVHDAGGGAESHPRNGRLHGVRTVDKLVIPRVGGDLVLPGVRYTYFDTDRREYVTLNTAPITLRVADSEGGASSLFTGGHKSEIELLSQDIQHIAPMPEGARPWPGPLPTRPMFWAALVLPALAWGTSRHLSRRRLALLSNPRRLRARAALRNAQQILDGEGEPGERAERALRGYVADRADRSASGLTHEQIQATLVALGVAEEQVREFVALLERCEASRYAVASSGEGDLESTKDLLRRIEEVSRES